MATQALVIAHACYGHNSFFKGNHLFRQWTDADAILDYLVFARRYVMECEERHGAAAVEEVLDACHALMAHGVDRYRRPAAPTLKAETARLAAREAHRERQFNDLWRTLPESKAHDAQRDRTRALPAGAAGEHPLFRREVLAEARAVAARARPHRAQARAVLRSAGADEGDERRLGDVLALHDPQPAARAGPGRRRLHARSAEEPHERHRAAGVRLEGVQRTQSVRAGLRAVLATCGASASDPTPRIARGSRELAGSDWRKTLDFAMRNFKDESFIAPVPVAAADPRLPPVRDRRPRGRETRSSSTASTTSAATGACASCSRSSTRRKCACPTCRSLRYERDGDRSLTLRHHGVAAGRLPRRRPQVVAHLRRLWGFAVRLETWDGEARVGDVVECAG